MKEKETQEILPEEQPVVVQETEPAPLEKEAVSSPGKHEPNESLFGTILIISFTLSFLAIAAYFGWSGYRMYQGVKAEKSTPSIEALPRVTEEEVESTASAPSEEAKTPEPTPVTTGSAVDKKTITIKVLNGGAAKGVAGTYAETLKKAGYTQTVVGNAFGNYTGAVLYHAVGKEKEAEFLRQEVVKNYPQVTMKVAPTGDKDANAASFVVILGK